MITKWNKNKVKVEFIKEYGATKKGVCKLLSISEAKNLEKDKIVTIVEVYNPASSTEKVVADKAGIKKVNEDLKALTKRIEDLEEMIEILSEPKVDLKKTVKKEEVK